MTSITATDTANYLSMRGRRIDLSSLWDSHRFDAKGRRLLKQNFTNAKPFNHLVIDGLFNSELLTLIHDEFEQSKPSEWNHENGDNESTRRLKHGVHLSPASELYFNTINSIRFTEFMTDITGIEHLIPDQTLLGGGLHENKTGDWFGIHVDFARHSKTFLYNECALITYLNKDWQESYGGSLELWDAAARTCDTRIVPVFGRTVILKQSRTSQHGHTQPVNAPGGKPRRSIVAYYYRNNSSLPELAVDPAEHGSFFLEPRQSVVGKAKILARLITPPLIMSWIMRLRGRGAWAMPVNHS